MLVLSRQRDETIMIGDDIEVTVVDIRGDKVRLGINAPKNVTVHRKEVYEAIRRENREAAQVKPEDLPGMKLPMPNQSSNPSATQSTPGSKFPRERVQGNATSNAQSGGGAGGGGGGDNKPSDGSAGVTSGPGGSPS